MNRLFRVSAASILVFVPLACQAPTPIPGKKVPSVVVTVPLQGSKVDARAVTDIVAVFDTDMDPATFTAETFRLTLGGATVAATVSYDTPGRRATLKPVEGLKPSSQYFATVLKTAASLEGQTLGADFSFDFWTTAGPVTGTDTQPPRAAILVPRSTDLQTSTQVFVVGTATDATAEGAPGSGVASVRVNDLQARPTASGFASWEATVTLAEGVGQEIVVAAADIAGNADPRAASIKVNVLASKPAVTLAAPADGAVLKDAAIAVTGTVQHAVAVKGVSVNGQAATETSPGFAQFAASLTLPEGKNQAITVDATDELGLNYPALLIRKISVDRSAPKATITSPKDQATLNQKTVTVSGTATDLTRTTKVTVNGVAAAAGGLDFAIWSASVTLLEGAGQVITVSTEDAAGNVDPKAAAITVTVNTAPPAPPTVSFTAPAANSTATASPVAATGTVSWPGTSHVATGITVNGVAATSTGTNFSTWSASVPVTEGPNTLIANVSTSAGDYTALASLGVRADLAAPTATITSPASGATLTSRTVTVTGTASDSSTITSIKVNTVAATAVTSNFATWSAVISLPDGPNTITVASGDDQGHTNPNAASVSVTVTRKPAWWNSAWKYRMPLTVDTRRYGPIVNENIFIRVDFSQLLTAVGATGNVDRNSIRVIDQSGATPGEMPSKVAKWYFNPDDGLVWFYAAGTINGGTQKTYHLYFDTVPNGPKTAPAYAKQPVPDVAVQYQDNGIAKVIGDYSGSFSYVPGTLPIPGTGGSHNCTGIADFDNDGDLDYVVSRYADWAIYYVENFGGGDGFAVFSSVPKQVGTRTTVTYANCMGIAVADFNEDGNMDFVIESDPREAGGMHYMQGNGNGTFSTNTFPQNTNGCWLRDLAVADFDADGNMDVAQGTTGCPDWYVYYGNGFGTFSQAVLAGKFTSDNNDHYAMAAGDFNDDGTPDVVMGGAYYCHDNTARGKFQGAGSRQFAYLGIWPYLSALTSVNNCHGWLESFDFNHDGLDDLIGYIHVNGGAQTGAYYWERDGSAPWAFKSGQKLGSSAPYWFGQGVVSPSPGHNLGFKVSAGVAEPF